MGSSPGNSELKEGAREWSAFYQKIFRKQLSRRKVIKLGSLVSMLGLSGAVQALIAACGGEEAAAPATTGTPSGGTTTGTAVPSAGITGDWDSTGTPPYKRGLPDDVAKVPEQWKQYPWVYKYGPWRYDWNIPVTRGGHIIVPQGSYADFNIMINGIPSQPTNNKLYNAGLREGLNLLTASIEPELVIREEHSADYTSWTFQLPDNVKFHNIAPVNGRPMTAEDVAFSFERHRNEGVFKSALRNVEKITAVDSRTVRFDLKQPQLTFRETLATPHFVVFAQEHFENQDLFKRQPIGTGPFILEFNEFQNKTDWIRNPEYWEIPRFKPEKYGNTPFPLADRYTRQYFANIVAAKEAFFAGKVDQLAPGGGLDTALVKEQLQRVPDAIVMTNAYWSCCPLGIMFQYKNSLFQDIRVRRALSMGFNREQVWSGGMDKTGVIGASPIPFDLAGYDLPLPLSDYGPNAQFNPEQAKQLLQEAGLNPPLKLSVFQSPQGNPAWQGALDTVIFNWKQAGVVDAEVVVREGQVFSQDLLNKSFPDMAFSIGFLSLGYSVDAMLTPLYLPDSPRNYGGIDDPELTDLLQKWAVATNPDDAVQLARQMTQRIVDQVDHLWLGWIGGIEVDQPWLHGIIMSTHNQPNGIGLGNYKYIWIDQTAPDGRGGRPI